jgi:hypothetical protein
MLIELVLGVALAVGALSYVLRPVLRPPPPPGAPGCVRCGEPLQVDARFCSRCGAGVPT